MKKSWLLVAIASLMHASLSMANEIRCEEIKGPEALAVYSAIAPQITLKKEGFNVTFFITERCGGRGAEEPFYQFQGAFSKGCVTQDWFKITVTRTSIQPADAPPYFEYKAEKTELINNDAKMFDWYLSGRSAQ